MSFRRYISGTRPFAVLGAWLARLGALFPERQILIRDNGRVRCLTIRRWHQWAGVLSLAFCLLWAVGASLALLQSQTDTVLKERELDHRAAELDTMRAEYHQAAARLDQFHSLFSSITCEVGNIQNSLLRIAEHNVATSNGAALPKLDAHTPECASLPAAAAAQQDADIATPPGDDPRRIVGLMHAPSDGELMKARVDVLSADLEKLRVSHGEFLQKSASIAQMRIGMLEKTLARVGVNPQSLVHSDNGEGKAEQPRKTEHFGQGGPFIPPSSAQAAQNANFSPMALFNNHASRLDHLNSAMRKLPLAAPLAEYEVTSPFGARNDPINAMTGIHEGVDLGAPSGTPVMATGDGVVLSASWRDRYGNLVEIQHAMNLRTRYAHLSKLLVHAGEKVRRGQVIGLVGTTGRSTGPHLHYEVRVGDSPTNPMKFIAAGRDVLQIHQAALHHHS